MRSENIYVVRLNKSHVGFGRHTEVSASVSVSVVIYVNIEAELETILELE